MSPPKPNSQLCRKKGKTDRKEKKNKKKKEERRKGKCSKEAPFGGGKRLASRYMSKKET
jgi:hypothetical protein